MTETKTFEEFDKLDLSSFRDQFLAFLHTEKDWVEGALVVSLEAPFGSGKSTFFAMLYSWLKSKLNPAEPTIPIPIYLNAWEDDHSGEPTLAIVAQLTEALKEHVPPAENELLSKICKLAGQTGRASLTLANDLIKDVWKVDLKKAAKAYSPEKAGEVIFEHFKAKRQALVALKECISQVVAASPLQVLILIDELDRCRPDYAVEYLESIKHLFNQTGLTFVLGVDRRQIEASTKCLFGENLNFDEYFRKFATRNIRLPNIRTTNSGVFCRHLISKYFQALNKKGEMRYNFAKFGGTSEVDRLAELLVCFNLTARQAHEMMRVLAHATAVKNGSNSQMIHGWLLATMIMGCLSVTNPGMYQKLGTSSASLIEIRSLFDETNLTERSKGWWGKVAFVANYRYNDKETIYNECFRYIQTGEKHPATIEDLPSAQRFIDPTLDMFEDMAGERESCFQKIHAILEGLKRFIEAS